MFAFVLQLIGMEAIYQAILLIPQQPSRATQLLLRIQRSEPRFLEYIKTMTLELYDRYAPRSLQQQIQYETICKHLIVVFNRIMQIDLNEKGNEAYLSIEKYYQWTIEIFLCDHISLSLKKTLFKSFTEVIKSICYQTARITQFVDHMLNNSMNSASSIFVYVEAMLQSSVTQLKKIESIKEIYQFLFAVLDLQYKGLINFYRSNYMESEVGQTASDKTFLKKIIEIQYMLDQVQNVFKFLQTIFKKNQASQSFFDLIGQIFFHPDIARHLSCVLKIQKDLFQNYEQPNPFNLKMIVMSNLSQELKNAINTCKTHCLSILKIILNVTDKDFNLFCTDKLLMRQLFNISELVINQLLICSQEKVFNTISSEIYKSNLIASMLSLLAVIINFKDLKQLFSSLDVQKLIRLTFFYSKTFEQEYILYKNSPQEYFYFNFNIYKKSPEKDDSQLVELIEQFSIRQKSVEFIITMNKKVQGFHNIILDICYDIIILENSLKNYNDTQVKLMFMQKYTISQDIFNCFNTQTALSVVTVLMQETWDRDEKYNKMYLIMSKIQINIMNHLEQYRLYMCLSFTYQIFIHVKGYKLFHQMISNVYKLVNKQSSVAYAGYLLIEKLLKSNINDKDYDIIIEKLLDDFVEVFSVARCSNPFQTIRDVLENKYIVRDFINLDWINRSMEVLNKRIINDIHRGHDNLSKMVLDVYADLLKVAEEKIAQNKSLPYPSFADQCIVFHEQLMTFADAEKFRYFSKIIQEDSFQNEDKILVSFSKILKNMLIQQIPLRDDQYDLILSFTLSLLKDNYKYESKLNKISFELLYQLIHVKIYSFDERIHSAILAWMKDNYYRDEVNLNRICIILQQMYYYIDNNNNQNQGNFIDFYSSIIQIMQKKFLQLLIQYHNYANALNQQTDINIKRINQLNINVSNKKTNPITIIRLLNTILLNPYFDIQIIRKVHDMLKKYNYQIIPSYDLAILVLSLESLFKRSRNISVIQCFRFTTELLGYNCNNPDLKCRKQTQIQIQIATMMQGLRTSLNNIDPYQGYCILTQRYVFESQDYYYVSQKNNQVEINIINFIKNDTYFRNLVKKLTLVRSVNNKTRMILKIRKGDE